MDYVSRLEELTDQHLEMCVETNADVYPEVAQLYDFFSFGNERGRSVRELSGDDHDTWRQNMVEKGRFEDFQYSYSRMQSIDRSSFQRTLTKLVGSYRRCCREFFWLYENL
jgi:hypothetical protein